MENCDENSSSLGMGNSVYATDLRPLSANGHAMIVIYTIDWYVLEGIDNRLKSTFLLNGYSLKHRRFQ